jgi:hypothetical protein
LTAGEALFAFFLGKMTKQKVGHQKRKDENNGWYYNSKYNISHFLFPFFAFFYVSDKNIGPIIIQQRRLYMPETFQ